MTSNTSASVCALAENLNITIAGTQLQFCGVDGLRIAPVAFEYPPFLGEHEFDRHLLIEVSVAGDDAPAGDAVLFDTNDGWMLTGDDTTRCARMPVRTVDGSYGARDIWRLRWQTPLQRAYAQVDKSLVDDGVVRHLAQYPLDQIMLTTLLATEGALLLHACGGVTAAGGIAFAGVSGAGKSTLTGLLADRAGNRFFSDDRLFLRRSDTSSGVASDRGCSYRLYGTPWAGDAHAARNEHTPLRALCFLTQSDSTMLRKLSPALALERLLPVTTLPWFDAAAIGHSLDACAMLIDSVPCFELRFERCGDAIEQALGELDRV